MGTIHATVAGLNVYRNEVTFPAEGGLNGLVFNKLSGGEGIQFWGTKAEAVRAARAIGWPADSVQRGLWTSPLSQLKIWVLECDGAYLATGGYDRILRLTHLTSTWERSAPGLAASGFSKRTRRSANQKDAGWVCTCRASGFTYDRSEAVRDGREHRAAMAEQANAALVK